MIERDALLQPSYSECKHDMPAKHKPEVRVWPLGSKFATSGLCLQIQASAHIRGGICDQAPDNSQDTFPATRCSRNTKLVLTLFFMNPCFCLCSSFTQNLIPPHPSIIIFILLTPTYSSVFSLGVIRSRDPPLDKTVVLPPQLTTFFSVTESYMCARFC